MWIHHVIELFLHLGAQDILDGNVHRFLLRQILSLGRLVVHGETSAGVPGLTTSLASIYHSANLLQTLVKVI